ncbi:MAG TPA: hypothetical protein PKD00_00415 [Burkholderiales bacterium]|nr:hypothetical protein [Burkholderiales bacterium]
MITKVLEAHIEGQIGYTYEWVVTQVENCGDFIVGQVLGSGTMIADEEDIELTIEHEEFCVSLTVQLIIKSGEAQCGLIYFDVIGLTVGLNSHWECVSSVESGPQCQQVEGLAVLPSHYDSEEACQECVECACSGDDSETPCSEFTFGGTYTCPLNPGDTGAITIMMTGGPSSFNPVTLVSIFVSAPISQLHVPPGGGFSFTEVGQTYTFLITLPSGTYNVTPQLAFGEDCTITSTPITSNCVTGPPPPPGGGTGPSDFVCCQGINEASAGTGVGNVGLLNCYVLDFGSNIDPLTQDLIFDFGANTVADKLEVYKGVVSCEDVYSDTVDPLLLVGATPYVGNIAHCLNAESNFVPAVGSKTEVRNDILNGVLQQTGVYGVGNPPDFYNQLNTSSFVSPEFADDLMGNCDTHSGSGNTYYPTPGCGGPRQGKARLIIPAGTYGNIDNKVTIVVHNNGTPSPYRRCNTNNITAWKLWVHCPECPTCEVDFELGGSCTDAGEGSIVANILEPFTGPVTLKLTPNSPLSLQYPTPLPLYVYLDANTTYYQLSTSITGDYLYTELLPALSASDQLTFLYTSGYNLVDMKNDSWTVELTDSDDCTVSKTIVLSCECLGYFETRTASICTPTALSTTVELFDSSCALTADSLQYTITPDAPWITVTVNGSDVVITSNDTPVVGTYEILLQNTCPSGECTVDNEGNEVIINVYEFDCAVGSVITPTTCGNSNGEIVVTLCPGATISWTDIISTSLTRTGLAAGNYTALVTDGNCTEPVSFEVPDSSTLDLATPDYTVACKETDAISVELTVSGGTAPYTLTLFRYVGGSWGVARYTSVGYVSGTSIPFASVTGGLPAGSYKFRIVDDAGCIKEVQFAITATAVPPVQFLTNPSYCEEANGEILFLSSGLVPGTHIVRFFNAAGVDCADFLDLPSSLIPWEGSSSYSITGLLAGTYSLCVMNNFTNCCDCKDVTVANVGDSPDVPSTTDINACVGSIVNVPSLVTCSSGSIPKFYTPGNSTPTTVTNITVTGTVTYDVRCQAANCYSDVDQLTITAVTSSPVTITGPSSVCKSATFPLAGVTASCNGTGTWSFPNNAGQILTFAGVGCNGTICGLPSAAWLEIQLLTANSVTLTFTCTNANGCISSGTKTINLVSTPLIQTQNLSFCPNQAISNGMLSSALLTSPLGYSCGVPTIYTNSNCTVAQSYPFNAPAAGVSVTKYLKVSCAPIDGGVSCATGCIPFTITGTSNPTHPVTVTPSCVGSTFSAVFNASATGAGTYAWLVNGVLQIGQTSNTLSLTGLTPGATLTVVSTFTPVSGCISSGGTTHTVGQLPGIVAPNLLPSSCVGDPIDLFITTFSNTGSVSITTSNPLVATVGNLFSTNGTVTFAPTNTTVGTATITITAYTGAGQTGCSTTITRIITVENCNPCSVCSYSFTGLNTDESSFGFSSIEVCGTTLSRYILLVKNSLGVNVAYIANITAATAGVTLPISGLNYVTTVSNPEVSLATPTVSVAWSLPLLVGTYTLHLIYASNLPGSCQNCVSALIPECYGIIDISCAGCVIDKSYSGLIVNEVDSTIFEMCIPCSQKCFKISLQSFGSNPDGVILSTTPDFSTEFVAIPKSTLLHEQATVKLFDYTTVPYYLDFSAAGENIPCISGSRKFYMKVRSGLTGTTSDTASWSLKTQCCDCITECPEFTAPCVKTVLDNMDGTYTYTLKANNTVEATKMFNNNCGETCSCRCSSIDGNIQQTPYNAQKYAGNNTAAIIAEAYQTTLGQCSSSVCSTTPFNFPICSGTLKKFLQGTVTYLHLPTNGYRLTFTNLADYTEFKTKIDTVVSAAVPVGCNVGKATLTLNLSAWFALSTIPTGCNDIGEVATVVLTLKCCDGGVCTDTYDSIVYDDIAKSITINLDHAIASGTGGPSICPTCFNQWSYHSGITNRQTGVIDASAELQYKSESILTSVQLNYGAAIEECNSFNSFILRLLDAGDVDSWVLYSRPLVACDGTNPSVNSLHVDISVGNKLLQFGDTFADAADAISVAALQALTLVEHSDGAAQGANNCIIFS